MFNVIPAGKPDPVSNCTVSNQTHSSFIVSCIPGFNGGLDQLFRLRVGNLEQTLLNMTSQVPKFQVAGLQSEKAFTVTVHSSNLRGQSEKVILQAFTTKPRISEKEINQAKIGSLKTRLIISPVLGVLIGVGSAIVLVSITLFVIMCCRVKYEKISRAVSRPTRQTIKKDITDELYVDLSINSPDLIPNNDGKYHNNILEKVHNMCRGNKQHLVFVIGNILYSNVTF